MSEIAPDDENSLGPDLDPPVDPFPPTPRGNLLRQIDVLTVATANARRLAQQYAETADANDERIAALYAELAALPENEE
jgi:hypothetical protein